MFSNYIFCTFGIKIQMTFEKTYTVRNNTLTIRLPKEFTSKRKVKVTIEEVDENRQNKLKLLKKAPSDPLFNSDVEEIKNDFQYSDKDML